MLTFGPFNYYIHRKISLRKLDGFTKSEYKNNTEIVLHFKDDYDERYRCGKHFRNIQKILIKLLTITSIHFKFYNVPDKKLSKYTTVKKDAEKGKMRRPEDKYEAFPPESMSALNYDLNVDTTERPSMKIEARNTILEQPEENEEEKKNEMEQAQEGGDMAKQEGVPTDAVESAATAAEAVADKTAEGETKDEEEVKKEN